MDHMMLSDLERVVIALILLSGFGIFGYNLTKITEKRKPLS